MPVKIKELAFVFHTTADVAKARAFYGGFLGLKTGMDLELAPGTWWTEYDIAGTALAVTNAIPMEGTKGAGLALEVPDLDAALAAAKAEGIPVTLEPQEFGVCRMFIISSPDGYAITLHQRKA